MEKCKDKLEREFYIKMTKRFGWTKNVLINNIENKAYVEYALKSANKPIGVSTYNISSTLPDEMKNLLPTPEEIIKRLLYQKAFYHLHYICCMCYLF